MAAGRAILSVSYTHLDVYKRQGQTYAGLELVLADASDAAHGEVEKAVRAVRDARVRYIRIRSSACSSIRVVSHAKGRKRRPLCTTTCSPPMRCTRR